MDKVIKQAKKSFRTSEKIAKQISKLADESKRTESQVINIILEDFFSNKKHSLYRQLKFRR